MSNSREQFVFAKRKEKGRGEGSMLGDILLTIHLHCFHVFLFAYIMPGNDQQCELFDISKSSRDFLTVVGLQPMVTESSGYWSLNLPRMLFCFSPLLTESLV